MPCYVVYKCFGYITDEELEKFLDIAKEKGYSYQRAGRQISFNGPQSFTLEQSNNQWSVNASGGTSQFLDDIKAGMNRDKFVQKWRSRNPGWNVQQVRA